MPDIHEEYERKHLINLNKYAKQIDEIYKKAIGEASRLMAGQRIGEGNFSVSKIPGINSRFNNILLDFNKNIQLNIVNGIAGEWSLSNDKNSIIIDKRIAKTRLANSDLKAALFDPNQAALTEFTNRKENGLNLSDRIWNHTKRFKNELEAGLGIGLSEGKSATEMARDLQRYLNNPDSLFRRVRELGGQLQLSNPAKLFNPGQGVYRSAYKNSLRLTRTETNMAYRQADMARYQLVPFIVGYEVRLSNNHPEYDICDVCAGRYPKNFIFRGWHPQCRCFSVPVMMTDKEIGKLEDAILRGNTANIRSVNAITDVPQSFKNWVDVNTSTVKGWRNQPYWVKDNFKGGDISKSLRFKTKPMVNITGYGSEDIKLLYSVNFAMLAKQIVTDKKIFKFAPQLNIDETGSVYFYTMQEGYSMLNIPLVTSKTTEFTGAFERVLNASLDKLPVDTTPAVFRGSALPFSKIIKYEESFTNGTVIVENSFISSSRNYNIAAAFKRSSRGDAKVLFTINGKSGRYVDNISAFGKNIVSRPEDEVLFKSKTKFKVVDFKRIDTPEGPEYEIDLLEI